MQLEHWMMFSTFAEQNYFTYPKIPKGNAYNGAVINANMASFAPSGMASFIMGKLHTDTMYIIDPMTHAFQHNPTYITNKKGELKSSIFCLAELYGEPISSIAGKAQLLPENLDQINIESFTKNVLDFQRNHLCQYMITSDAAKYLEENDIKKPTAIIAPYFYMTELDWDVWLKINLNCLLIARSLKNPKERLFAEIVIDHGVLLDKTICCNIRDAYDTIRNSIDGFILWVDNFDEQSASTVELQALKDLCSELKSVAPALVILHGGYFSIMLGGPLGNKCLNGVTHGPEFGEYRSVVPVGGGIPIAKYYVPHLHVRVRYSDASALFRTAGWLRTTKQFYENVCDCEECKETLNGDTGNFTLFGVGTIKNVRRGAGMAFFEFPSSETKNRCLRHYLQRKYREFDVMKSISAEQVVDELKVSINMHKPYVGDSGVAHLRRWLRVLNPQ